MDFSMNNMVDGALGLGISGFMLLIVLIITLYTIVKMSGVFLKLPEKFDTLTERLADSNKELSNQLIKTSAVQESILLIMKETMIAVNNNTGRMSIIEEKIENNISELRDVSLSNNNVIRKLDTIDTKISKVMSEIKR